MMEGNNFWSVLLRVSKKHIQEVRINFTVFGGWSAPISVPHMKSSFDWGIVAEWTCDCHWLKPIITWLFLGLTKIFR